MMAINGRIQREGEVVHLVAQRLFDLLADLVGLADLDSEFKLPTGRGDEFAHGDGPGFERQAKACGLAGLVHARSSHRYAEGESAEFSVIFVCLVN